jgi:hypothetical protein
MNVEILPGLVLSDREFELAAAGVAEHAPMVGPLTRAKWLNPAGWLRIPDQEGEVSKDELILVASEEITVKLNRWWCPDVRGSEVDQAPHNHRWSEFRGHLLYGGYTETRFVRSNIDPETGRADVESFEAVHDSPDANLVAHEVYHEVTDIHMPGTLSLMVCGYGRFGDWGHLDTRTGRTRKDQPVAGFNEAFAALNPHKR